MTWLRVDTDMPERELNRRLTTALIRRGCFETVAAEVPIGPGMRVDILARQPNGHLALFELKAHVLRQRDVAQIVRYARHLEAQGNTVHAHLVGAGWRPVSRPEDIVLMDWSVFWPEMES